MSKLTKHENYKVAVVIDGSSFISAEDGILHETIKDDEVLLYIKSKDEKNEIKIKITRE